MSLFAFSSREGITRRSIDTKRAVYVEVPDETDLATAEGLEQGYVTVPSDQRFNCTLYCFSMLQFKFNIYLAAS